VVYLTEGEIVHQRRPKPADGNATAAVRAPVGEWHRALDPTDLWA